MNRPLGDLVDRLSIVNIKLYMVQDIIHKAKADGVGVDAETTQKLVDLNLERNKLMTAIDETFARGVKFGIVDVDLRTKVL